MPFLLQFPTSEINSLASSYGELSDDLALSAGKLIREGQFSRADARTIYYWKTNGRGISRFDRNTEEEIEDAFRLAIAAKTPRSAISVLCGLFGVDVPVASAFLALIFPENTRSSISVRFMRSAKTLQAGQSTTT